MRASRRTRKVIVSTILASITAAVLFVLVGIPLYVFPSNDDVEGADLIYVIGPPVSQRTALAEELVDRGVAETVLVSAPGDMWMDSPYCETTHVICERPKPATTKGEVLLLEEYIKQHNVEKTVVITFDPHVSRTRFIFDKCFEGDVAVVGVDEYLGIKDWAYQYLYQSSAFLKAWATPCADATEL